MARDFEAAVAVKLCDAREIWLELNPDVGHALLMMGLKLEEIIGGSTLLIGKTDGAAVLFAAEVTVPWP